MNMNRNLQVGTPRFGIAVHALVWLAQSGGLLTSSMIAGQVNTHATFMRKVLALLSQAGIVEAREGRDGGYYLKRAAEELSLADVYLAVKSECTEVEQLAACGEVGYKLDKALGAIMSEAEQHKIELLKRYTIADMMKEIELK